MGCNSGLSNKEYTERVYESDLLLAPLDILDLLRLALHISEVLVGAEGEGIVHRDIKPENIIMGQNGDFWLLDFGVARDLGEESLTPTAAPFGPATLGYAPLEQIRNIKGDIDIRADLFALGITLYECALGGEPVVERPFLSNESVG